MTINFANTLEDHQDALKSETTYAQALRAEFANAFHLPYSHFKVGSQV